MKEDIKLSGYTKLVWKESRKLYNKSIPNAKKTKIREKVIGEYVKQ